MLVDVHMRFAQMDGRIVGPEALAKARRLLAAKRDKPGFGNARDVRSLFSAVKRRQISRLADERRCMRWSRTACGRCFRSTSRSR